MERNESVSPTITLCMRNIRVLNNTRETYGCIATNYGMKVSPFDNNSVKQGVNTFI